VLVVVLVARGAILFPSLALLFRLVLRGQFDPGTATELARAPDAKTIVEATASGLLTRSAFACVIAGIGLLTVADSRLAHAVGVVCLLAFVVLGFAAMRPTEIAQRSS
jgi:cytochrome bd ubiquinol oxidase subunit II